MKTSKIILTLLLITMAKSSYAQDWGNLDFYKNQNQELLAMADSGKRIVLMGDSITQGWSEANGNPAFFDGKPYINRGIGGQTTPQMLLRFRQDVIDLKPKIVVILAGTNDIAENTGPVTLKMIMDNIVSMAEIAQANNIKVMLCSVLPAYDYPWKHGMEPAGKIVALNSMIKAYADNHKIRYVDYFTAMKDERNGLKAAYSEDGVHPNKTGYQTMGPIMEKTIQKH